MKVAIYARESSADVTKAPPIEEQLKRGRQWAEQNGHVIVIEYVDNGYSGGDWNRPGWNQSIKDAKRHLWQMMWVWNQDRLARDTEQFLFFYRNITGAGAKLWEDTANNYIDMSDLGGRVKHQTMAQAAEIFRLVTSEKVRKAYQRKKQKGESWGRKKKPFDETLACELRNKGFGWRTIGKQLGVSHNTVRRALINRVIIEHNKKQLKDGQKWEGDLVTPPGEK